MISFFIKIEYGGIHAMTKTAMRRVTKQTLRYVAETWHKEIRPKHFTEEGAREYEYEERTERFMQRKERGGTWKNKGKVYQLPPSHQRPLVWTGESEKRTRNPKITATPTRASVTMNAPVLNFRRHMVRELTEISQRDSDILSDKAVKALNILLHKQPYMTVKVYT